MTKSSEDLLKEYDHFLGLSAKTRWEKVCSILDFFIAGEKYNKQLLFFLFLGNYHKKHKSFIIVRGGSSGGKNHLVSRVLYCFPKNDVYIIDSATAQSLKYDSEIDKCKLIYLRELEEGDTIQAVLKALYNEEGFIHKETVKKYEDKTEYFDVKSHFLQRKGVVTTFSFEHIAIDIVNRAWVLNPDQSYEQNRDVIDFGLDTRKNMIERDLEEKKMMQYCFFLSQCIQSLDFEFKVFIPYIEKLKPLLPDTFLNVRRDKDKLFDLIEYVTLWNQKNRKFIEFETTRYLFATYIDLKMALEISQDIFTNTLFHLDDVKKAILDFMTELQLVDKVIPMKKDIINFGSVQQTQLKNVVIEETAKYKISEVYEEMRSQLSISRRTVQRKLNDLYYEGYLNREKDKNTYFYTKLRDYNLEKRLKLDEIKDEINALVEQSYNHYSKMKPELLENNEPKPL